MGIFSKKPPCPICGGKISWFLPSKIEGQYICDPCYSKIDMEREKADNLTLEGFREYLAFYEENQLLKDKFEISELIDFGFWDTKIIFDYQNKLFCMSKTPDETVFEGKDLKFFTIKEDNLPLFECSAQGIRRYTSTVQERAIAMAPQISQFLMNRNLARTLDKEDDGQENRSVPIEYFDGAEPFWAFNVELHLDHPYWTIIKCDMDGPRFDKTQPSVDDYLRDYRRSIEKIEKLVMAFKAVAFPDAPVLTVGLGGTGSIQATMAAPVDAIEEIRKYKALLDEGIISQQEFDAKKKQLLGI
jgi:hypothetical protein